MPARYLQKAHSFAGSLPGQQRLAFSRIISQVVQVILVLTEIDYQFQFLVPNRHQPRADAVIWLGGIVTPVNALCNHRFALQLSCRDLAPSASPKKTLGSGNTHGV
jgi:hypothetical protein